MLRIFIYQYMMVLVLINGILNKLRKSNKKNKTPLFYAKIYNSRDLGDLLLSKRADIKDINIIYLKMILFLINGI